MSISIKDREHYWRKIIRPKTKQCRRCEQVLPLAKFYAERKSADGRATMCKDCDDAKGATYRASKAGKRSEKRKYLKKIYDITLEQWNEMYRAQGGVCAICHKRETTKNRYGMRQLSVDHNHETGKIRGLLCSNCNSMLGFVYDDPATLIEAAAYLTRNQ